MIFRRLISSALLAVYLSAFAQNSDWTQWRGAQRDGIATAFAAPQTWPEQLKQVWRIEVGEGHASPLVQDRRVFVFTRFHDQETISAFELANGKLIWRVQYAAPYRVTAEASAHAKGPFATPALYEGKLYTFGITEVLSAHEAASGKLIWRKDYSKEYQMPHPYYGTSLSPLLVDGLCLVHVGGPGNGAFVALEAATGAERWRWSGDGPAFASPIVAELYGVQQVIAKTQQHVIGVELHSGKLLWQAPYKVAYDNTITTPVLYQDLLLLSDFETRLHAIQIKHGNGAWSTAPAWRNEQINLFLNTPVLREDLLFGFSNRNGGQYFCLAPRTGELLWTSAGRQAESATTLLAGKLVVILTESGELIFAEANERNYAPKAKYQAAESNTFAHPVLIKNTILIKEQMHLTRWELR